MENSENENENEILELTIEEEVGTWDEVISQELNKQVDDIFISFNVNNLNERPEDAIIDRDLFDAYDYIKAIKLGMKLREKGYKDIKFKTNTINSRLGY